AFSASSLVANRQFFSMEHWSTSELNACGRPCTVPTKASSKQLTLNVISQRQLCQPATVERPNSLLSSSRPSFVPHTAILKYKNQLEHRVLYSHVLEWMVCHQGKRSRQLDSNHGWYKALSRDRNGRFVLLHKDQRTNSPSA
ncbi:unnamed protein product, partial [Ectocarpus sp. 12 AP-2014]